MKIGVVNYHAGNLTSIESALNFLKANYFVSSDPNQLLQADRLIFPGVGESRYAMQELKASGTDQMLFEFVAKGKALFGICLGAQILFSHSEENNTPLLSIFPGEVCLFDSQKGLKIPHMGWNTLSFPPAKEGRLFQGIPEESSFYFVHSYYIKPADENIVCAHCEYGLSFCAAVESGNVFAAQFHPEKSGAVGLKMLENFLTFKE